MDFQNIAQTALGCLDSLLNTWLPGGTVHGGEYVVKNPTRPDSKAGSFKINMHTGAWSDFATGDGGGDAIALYAYLNNVSQVDAARDVSVSVGCISTERPTHTKPENKSEYGTLLMPVPDNAPEVPDVRKVKIDDDWIHYKILHYWPYHNAEGVLLGYIVRYETPEGKETPPLTLWKNASGAMKWRFKGFPEPRPLYNLYLLSKFPNAAVIIVEGEKCAEVLQALIDGKFTAGKYVVVTWMGGSNGIEKTDFSPLKGRNCILWPDFDLQKYGKRHPRSGEVMDIPDQPGMLAMRTIADKLRTLSAAAKLKLVNQLPDKPSGWDVADAILIDGWNIDQVFAFIKTNATEIQYSKPVNEKSVTQIPITTKPPVNPLPDIQEPFPLPPEDYDSIPVEDDDSAPFRCLGYNAGLYYYLPNGTRQVFAIKAEAHGSKSFLGIAPLQYWERTYPGDKGANWAMAANALMRINERVGVYNYSRQRGRGAWYDAGRSILHLGDRLIVDGVEQPISSVKTKNIYEAGPELEFTNIKPIEKQSAIKLREIMDMLFWEKPISATLLAGWCVIAPICGGLKCRPHIWLTASAGSGKSHIIDNIIKPTLGEFALYVQSTTTSAGVRQTLGCDALPVLIDEFEAEDYSSQQRIQSMLELARQSFSDTGAKIIKGSQSGRASMYQVRSVFFMSSIGVSMSQHADATRFSVLSLGRPRDTDSHSKQEHFDILNKKISETLTEEWCAGLRARAIKLVPQIRANADTFALAVADKIGNRRSGDQVGPMLAGAYSLTSNSVITYEKARKWVEKQDWSEQQNVNEESDESKCLNTLLQYTVRMKYNEEISIAELIERCIEKYDTLWTEAEKDDTEEATTLKRLGIRVDKARTYVYVASSSTGIKAVFKDTPWAKSYFGLLCRLKDIVKVKMRFIGTPANAVGVPLGLI